MAILHQKRKSLFTVAAGFSVLVTFILYSCAQNGISTTPIDTPTPNQELSTPELIDQALAKGEITEEERLLYLAYAVYEYESLPARFRGNVGWRATFVVRELHEAVNTPSIFCSMNPHIQSEFQRLFNPETTCK